MGARKIPEIEEMRSCCKWSESSRGMFCEECESEGEEERTGSIPREEDKFRLIEVKYANLITVPYLIRLCATQ